MSGEIASLWAKIGADVKDFNKGTQQVKQGLKQTDAEIQKTKAGFKGLNDTIKLAAASMAVIGVAKAKDYIMELDKLGRESIRLKDSFKDLAQQHQLSSKAIITALQEASGHTISDMDLMLGANRALKFGLAGTADQFRDLMLVARYYGRQMGVETADAFDRMVTGMGRGSIQILDDLGIVGLSFSQTTTKADILAQVIKKGMAEIAASGGVMEDAADRTARMAVEAENLNQRLGELVAKSGIVDIYVDFVTQGTTGWITALDAIAEIDAWAAEHHTTTVAVVFEAYGLGDVVNAWDRTSEVWDAAQLTLGRIDQRTFEARQAARAGIVNSGGFGGAADDARDFAGAIDEVSSALRRMPYGDDYSAAYGFSDEGVLEAKLFMLKADQEIADEREKEAEKQRKEAKQYWEDFKQAGEQAWSTISGFVDQAFSSFDDFIRINLQGTSADVGDAWDEMARRAEAIINDMYDEEGKQIKGKTSPWLSMFDIPQDVLERGGDTLKAYIQKLAADIRESPTVQELGQVGIDALVKNAKKGIFDQLGKEQLNLTVGQELLKDPEVVKALETLGVDVQAALASGTERTNAILEAINVSVPEEIKLASQTANALATEIKADSATTCSTLGRFESEYPDFFQTQTGKITDAIREGLKQVLDVRVVDGSVTISGMSGMSGMSGSSADMLAQMAALS